MTSFKDFFNSKTKNPGEPSGSTAIAAVSSAVARGLTSSSDVLTVTTGTFEWSNSEKEKFAQQVGEQVWKNRIAVAAICSLVSFGGAGERRALRFGMFGTSDA